MTFNMRPIMDQAIDSPNTAKDVIYDLYGVVVHSGWTPSSGHYYSYCKSEGGRWAECDDSTISGVRSETEPLN